MKKVNIFLKMIDVPINSENSMNIRWSDFFYFLRFMMYVLLMYRFPGNFKFLAKVFLVYSPPRYDSESLILELVISRNKNCVL